MINRTRYDAVDDLNRLFLLVGEALEQTGGARLGMIGAAESRITDYDSLLTFSSDWIGTRNAEDGVPAASL